MNFLNRLIYLASIYALLTCAIRAETTSKPYFQISTSSDTGGETLPLKFNVAIEGTVARANSNSWTDHSSWDWDALLNPLNGPWRSETVIQSDP